jgi:hypothetical protein
LRGFSAFDAIVERVFVLPIETRTPAEGVAKAVCKDELLFALAHSWSEGKAFPSAYSWACLDSVFHFNADMMDQAIALGRDPAVIDSALAPAAPVQPNNNIWLNYNSTADNGYVPGLSFYRYKLFNMTTSDQLHSAGSDCAGFIVMSASYDDTFYQIHVPDERETTTSPQTLLSREVGALDSGYSIPLPDFLVPGDIVEFPGHWAMILSINRKPDPLNPNIIEDRIMLIEATDWGELRVMNEHSLQFCIEHDMPVTAYYRLGVK